MSKGINQHPPCPPQGEDAGLPAKDVALVFSVEGENKKSTFGSEHTEIPVPLPARWVTAGAHLILPGLR